MKALRGWEGDMLKHLKKKQAEKKRGIQRADGGRAGFSPHFAASRSRSNRAFRPQFAPNFPADGLKRAAASIPSPLIEVRVK